MSYNSLKNIIFFSFLFLNKKTQFFSLLFSNVLKLSLSRRFYIDYISTKFVKFVIKYFLIHLN